MKTKLTKENELSDDERGLKILEQLFSQSKKIIKKKGSIKFIFNESENKDE